MSDSSRHEPVFTLAYLPWLSLPNQCSLGGVTFVPWAPGKMVFPYQDFTADIDTILADCRTIWGKPVTAATLAYLSADAPCAIDDAGARKIDRARQLLALPAFSSNEYGKQNGAYANATAFEVYFQRFRIGQQELALEVRRRDGTSLIGGPRHGQVQFTLPAACLAVHGIRIDNRLLEAIERVLSERPPLAERLFQAASLLFQSHTDASAVTLEREAVLLQNAIEQWLAVKGSSDAVFARAVADRLRPYGQIRVAESQRLTRLTFHPNHEEANKAESMHWKWAFDFYQLRSSLGHEGTARTGGWDLPEHVLVATFLFPLLVKLLLAEEGFYELQDADRDHLGVVDRLLDEASLCPLEDGDLRWHDILLSGRGRHATSRALDEFFALNPQPITPPEGESE